MLVTSIMTRSVITTEPSRTVAAAQRLMHEGRFRHLPVVSNAQLVGIVSDRDLATAPREASLRSVMHADVISVTPDTPVEVAAHLMVDNKIGALTVIDGLTNALVGIVTQSDLFAVLARLLGGEGPGTRLELCLTDVPRQLATLARIADELHVPIAALISLPTASNARGRRIVLRIGTIAASPFVDALRQAGIDVNDSDD